MLSEVDFGDRRVDVRGWHRIQFIMHLAKPRYVRCIGNIDPLGPLAALPSLPALREPAIDHRPPHPLAGLERWPTVVVLEVFGVMPADDLRGLPALEHLVVHQPESPARLEELRRRLPAVRITT